MGRSAREHMRYVVSAFVAGVCVLAAGCGGGSPGASSAKSTTPTSTPVPPLWETALPGLLLTPEQLNPVMGAKELAVTRTRVEMSDDSATMAPRECLGIDGAAQAAVYAGSGFTAVRDISLSDGDNFTHFVEQAVVLFPSARQANDFFAASAQQWPACHTYTHTQSGTQWSAGPISNTNGMLSTVATQQEAKAGGWACGRALAARNNVVIDVNTCSSNPGDTAVNIANQIAARVAHP